MAPDHFHRHTVICSKDGEALSWQLENCNIYP